MRQRTDFEVIRESLPAGELLAQLAEEAAELAQAALKFRRVLDGRSRSPVSFRDGLDSLREELAGVNVCIRALGLSFGDEDIMEIFAQKRTRWRERLEDTEDR